MYIYIYVYTYIYADWWRTLFYNHPARVSIIFQERYPRNREGKPEGLTMLTQAVGWDAEEWFKQVTWDAIDPRAYFEDSCNWEPVASFHI